MKTVGDILRNKGAQVHSISPQETVLQALTEMAKQDVGALLVMDKRQIQGIISERDYARKVILKGRSSRALLVSEVMSRDVLCVSPAETVEDCMSLMTRRRVRHLPVLRNDQLVGLVSIGDIVKGLLEDKQGEIRQLENYIYGIQ